MTSGQPDGSTYIHCRVKVLDHSIENILRCFDWMILIKKLTKKMVFVSESDSKLLHRSVHIGSHPILRRKRVAETLSHLKCWQMRGCWSRCMTASRPFTYARCCASCDGIDGLTCGTFQYLARGFWTRITMKVLQWEANRAPRQLCRVVLSSVSYSEYSLKYVAI